MQKLLEKLFRDYYKDVYLYLYGLCRDADISEELASEVFLEVVKSIGGFRGEAEIKTWLFSVARHRWYAWLRKKKREPQTVLLEEWTPGDGQDLEDAAAEKELLEKINGFLEEETERAREIVRMRMEGYSYYEISRKCQISENSARVLEFRAKERLRERLKKEGYELPDREKKPKPDRSEKRTEAGNKKI